jgi:hypothetical protein
MTNVEQERDDAIFALQSLIEYVNSIRAFPHCGCSEGTRHNFTLAECLQEPKDLSMRLRATIAHPESLDAAEAQRN